MVLAIAGTSSTHAQEVAPAAAVQPPEVALPIEPTIRQPVAVQPTVGPSAPALRAVRFRNNLPDLRENSADKDVLPPGRHWKLLLGFGFTAAYDDNIFLSRRAKEEDFIFTLSPSIGIQFGDPNYARNSLSLIYTPSFVFFTDPSDQDAVEHEVELRFARQTDRWKLEGNARFLSLSGGNNPGRDVSGAPITEAVGERVDRQVYSAGLKYNFIVSDKTSFEIGLAGNYTDYSSSGFTDTLDLIDQNFIDFLVTGKTSVGLGFGVGYAKSEGGPDQVYEQVNGRVQFRPTSKLRLAAQAGVEFRQIEGGDNQTNGVFGLSATFTPTDRSTITLDAYRHVLPSAAFAETNYTVTGVAITLSQQIRFFTFTLSTGYESSEYESIGRDLSFSRTDNYFFVRPSVQWTFRQWATVELFYQYRNNDSELPQFEFANNQIGLKVGISF
jgi:hypothetical protein